MFNVFLTSAVIYLLRMMKNFCTIVWLLSQILSNIECSPRCSNAYGSQPCQQFVPAPPGKTPPCARPGQTFCEYIDNYPSHLINYLVDKWQYDHSTILKDESRDDFASVFFPPPSPVYGPPNYQSYGPNNLLQAARLYPEPIYIPKPQHPFQDNGFRNGHFYTGSNGQNFSQGFNGYHDKKPVYQEISKDGQLFTYIYNKNFPQLNRPIYDSSNAQSQSYYTDVNPQNAQYNNDLWRRRLENKYDRLRRSLRKKRSHRTILNAMESGTYNGTVYRPEGRRKKRQSTVNGEQMCPVRSQFITPKAALNTEGNWMYVVNMPENRYSQLVQANTCVRDTCNGICSLPIGYSSKCEQRYAQKRLVALKGTGDQVYTDLFWFPSCCVCSISNS